MGNSRWARSSPVKHGEERMPREHTAASTREQCLQANNVRRDVGYVSNPLRGVIVFAAVGKYKRRYVDSRSSFHRDNELHKYSGHLKTSSIKEKVGSKQKRSTCTLIDSGSSLPCIMVIRISASVPAKIFSAFHVTTLVILS